VQNVLMLRLFSMEQDAQSWSLSPAVSDGDGLDGLTLSRQQFVQSTDQSVKPSAKSGFNSRLSGGGGISSHDNTAVVIVEETADSCPAAQVTVPVSPTARSRNKSAATTQGTADNRMMIMRIRNRFMCLSQGISAHPPICTAINSFVCTRQNKI
jgi:hypothetical protein